jgi:hypothetical protein
LEVELAAQLAKANAQLQAQSPAAAADTTAGGDMAGDSSHSDEHNAKTKEFRSRIRKLEALSDDQLSVMGQHAIDHRNAQLVATRKELQDHFRVGRDSKPMEVRLKAALSWKATKDADSAKVAASIEQLTARQQEIQAALAEQQALHDLAAQHAAEAASQLAALEQEAAAIPPNPQLPTVDIGPAADKLNVLAQSGGIDSAKLLDIFRTAVAEAVAQALPTAHIAPPLPTPNAQDVAPASSQVADGDDDEDDTGDFDLDMEAESIVPLEVPDRPKRVLEVKSVIIKGMASKAGKKAKLVKPTSAKK